MKNKGQDVTEWLEISLITKRDTKGSRIRMNPHSRLVITRTPWFRSACVFTLQWQRRGGGEGGGEGGGVGKGNGVKGGKRKRREMEVKEKEDEVKEGREGKWR